MLERIKAGVPWYVKIPAKIMLSRLPIHYDFWRKVRLFRLGDMDRPDYVVDIVRSHLRRAGGSGSLRPGFVALELGPGDSIASAIVTKALGASLTYLVDSGDYATHDMSTYRKQISYLSREGISEIALPPEAGFGVLLSSLNARYLTGGIESLREIPDDSVDFIWSEAVLEHVRRKDFDVMVAEMRRVLALGGVCSHSVDLADHLGGALNNLRFSDRVWESDFMAGSGFYTNRIRFSEMIETFRGNGFLVRVVRRDRWDSLPTPRSAMAGHYRSWPEEDLLVRRFEVLLRRA